MISELDMNKISEVSDVAWNSPATLTPDYAGFEPGVRALIRLGHVGDAMLEHWLQKAEGYLSWNTASPDMIGWGFPIREFARHSPRLDEPGMFDRLPVWSWEFAIQNPNTPKERIEALAADPAPYQSALADLLTLTDPDLPGWSTPLMDPARRMVQIRAEAVQAARVQLGLPRWRKRFADDGSLAPLEAARWEARGRYRRMCADPLTRPVSRADDILLKQECERIQQEAYSAWRKRQAELLKEG